MQNLLTSSQMRDADAHTISSQAITSLELMEAASIAFVKEFKLVVSDKHIPVSIYCGTGNNGGDGLAIARLLKEDGFENITVVIARFFEKSTADFEANLERVKLAGISLTEVSEISQLPEEKPEIIIDGLLGSGLSKPVEGKLTKLIDYINALRKKIISIDVPSGFPCEGTIDTNSAVIKAALVISFQRPKINFFFPESDGIIDEFKTVNIGLDEPYIQSRESHWKLTEEKDIRNIIKPRKNFSHKGTYGHALIIAGSEETMGAALMCADACLHAGAGLTTACIPESGLVALNTRSPEIMALLRDQPITAEKLGNYTAIALGPGLGTDDGSLMLLKSALAGFKAPMVLDADALTILSKLPELLEQLPALSILTPHMKEFDRMFGDHKSWWERIETARQKATELNVIIVLKNQYSFIVMPDGAVLINPTGNPAMAVGGMGDVLTGMITGFMAQGYSPAEAAVISCFLHGKAGDDLKDDGMNSIPPRYVIEKLPFVINDVFAN